MPTQVIKKFMSLVLLMLWDISFNTPNTKVWMRDEANKLRNEIDSLKP
jgi:hypothetical protein